MEPKTGPCSDYRSGRTPGEIGMQLDITMQRSSDTASGFDHGGRPQRVIIFALHKTASMFLYSISKALAAKAGLPFFSPNENPPLDTCDVVLNPELLIPPGVYAPIRAAVDVPQPERTSMVVHLRDPRDALVSFFYSYCYGHVGSVPGGTGFRAAVAERGIDEFVLNLSTSPKFEYEPLGPGAMREWELVGNYRDRYKNLCMLAKRWPEQITLLHYETMTTRFEEWLVPFAGAFGFRDEQDIASLARQFGGVKPPSREDAYAHMRRLLPGDHREKLKPETISRLNEVFELQ